MEAGIKKKRLQTQYLWICQNAGERCSCQSQTLFRQKGTCDLSGLIEWEKGMMKRETDWIRCVPSPM